MQIIVNNEPRIVADDATVGSLINGLPAGGTAVAVNGRLIPRDLRDTTTLKDGDQVIIISAAYGG